MNLLDWFDPDNIEHLKAYAELEKTGIWPVGFIPEGIKFPSIWHVTLNSILASKYVELVLNKKKAYVLLGP